MLKVNVRKPLLYSNLLQSPDVFHYSSYREPFLERRCKSAPTIAASPDLLR